MFLPHYSGLLCSCKTPLGLARLILMSVLIRVTNAEMKHHDQKQLEEERVYLAYIS